MHEIPKLSSGYLVDRCASWEVIKVKSGTLAVICKLVLYSKCADAAVRWSIVLAHDNEPSNQYNRHRSHRRQGRRLTSASNLHRILIAGKVKPTGQKSPDRTFPSRSFQDVQRLECWSCISPTAWTTSLCCYVPAGLYDRLAAAKPLSSGHDSITCFPHFWHKIVFFSDLKKKKFLLLSEST